MRKIIASIKFILFWLWVALQFPIALILWPFGARAGVWHFKFFMSGVLQLAGICVRVCGEISTQRPLLIVGNHISVFEFTTFPASFGGSFFGKAEIEKMPVVGWFARRFGVVFVSRKSSDAHKMAALIDDKMAHAKWPMVIYPEGTTSNGSIILPFKSSMFDFIAKGANMTVQPMVMLYRDRCGNSIPDQVMADDYAYFDNAKMPEGACQCKRERSAFGQVFHIFELGGFMVEFHMLPPADLHGLDRKQIALKLHDTIEQKFIKEK